MPAIHVMMKPASGLCNMRCQYCFYADEMEKRSQASYGIMSFATLENVIRRTLEFAEGSCTIAFQGGEPTLAGLDFFRECIRLEQKYNTKNVTISHALQTNGYGLNEEWCQFFAKNHFLIGLSVDGIKATHDLYRKDAVGKDTYFRVLESAKLLEAAGVEFNVLMVVNGKTAPKIRRIYENFRKLGFSWQQYIACLDPISERQGQEEYSLSPEMYGRFLIELFDCGIWIYGRENSLISASLKIMSGFYWDSSRNRASSGASAASRISWRRTAACIRVTFMCSTSIGSEI